MKWSEDLFDQFTMCAQKTECSLTSVRDMLAFYKKRASIEDEYGKSLLKLAKSAQSSKRVVFKTENNKNASVSESPYVVNWYIYIVDLSLNVGNLSSTTRKMSVTSTSFVIREYQSLLGMLILRRI